MAHGTLHNIQHRTIVHGTTHGGITLGGAFDFHALLAGQSHAAGFADDSASGSGNLTGGDGGLKYRVPFTATKFNQQSATAPASPMVYNINTGTIDLQPYAAGGQSNTSILQTLGRELVNRGCCVRPALSDFAVSSSSIPGHWLPASNFPAAGTKLYAAFIAFALARRAEFGRLDCIIWQIGETDSATQARIDSMQADWTSFMASIRSDLGMPTLPIFLGIINTQTSGGAGGLVEQYRLKQIAFIPTDVDATGFDGSMIPLEADPHYLMGGYAELAILLLLKMIPKFFPGKVIDNPSIGGAPRYVGGSSGYSCQATPNTTRPRGWFDPQVGDIELLVLHSSGVAHTLTVNTAAGFTQIAQRDSVTGASHRMITLYTRTITQPMLDARTADELDGVKRGCVATPAIDCGAATLNFATIHCIRGSSGVTVTAATGANNTGSTSVVIGGFTTDHNNSLALICTATNQAAGLITGISNAALQNVTKGREGAVNPGTGSINMSMYWSTIPTSGTVVGNTTVTFGASSLNAGAIVVFNP